MRILDEPINFFRVKVDDSFVRKTMYKKTLKK